MAERTPEEIAAGLGDGQRMVRIGQSCSCSRRGCNVRIEKGEICVRTSRRAETHRERLHAIRGWVSWYEHVKCFEHGRQVAAVLRGEAG